MKLLQKNEARNLRFQGHSINEIRNKLNVSKASVSLWVRDIELTCEQKESIGKRSKSKIFEIICKNAQDRKNRYQKIREGYQQQGRSMVENCSKDFVAGVMLYWAEGSKKRNSVVLTNSDPDLLYFFINFLREYFKPKEEKFRITIRWFSDNDKSLDELKTFWINKLKIAENIITDEKDVQGKTNTNKKIGKLPYGIVRIEINDSSIIQKIYGAIQEFAGFNNPKWVL